ncbi:MAG: tetratricopeptide repeat protein [Proteobacteria bacterium]|nr:tetratricopeptide repeat protein [Pseudomonadota bacterium]
MTIKNDNNTVVSTQPTNTLFDSDFTASDLTAIASALTALIVVLTFIFKYVKKNKDDEITEKPIPDKDIKPNVRVQIGHGIVGDVGDNSTVIIGISEAKYERDLIAERERTKKEAEKVHGLEKQNLLSKIKILVLKLANPESYKDHIRYLEERIVNLEKLQDDGISSKLIEEAKEALIQGDDKKADDLYKKVQENDEVIMERAAKEHAKASERVAQASFERGKIAEENINYQDAYEQYKRATQSQPENTEYLNKAGIMAWTLGYYDKAIEYFELALKSDIKTFGQEHPSVARDRNNLGSAWLYKGNYDKAIEYYELALKSDIKTFGQEHPDVASDRNNLGAAWADKGEYDKAIEYYELALKSDIKTFGQEHPDVAIDRNNLGTAWADKGEYDKAIEYYELALKSDIKTLGQEHPRVKLFRTNIQLALDAKNNK